MMYSEARQAPCLACAAACRRESPSDNRCWMRLTSFAQTLHHEPRMMSALPLAKNGRSNRKNDSADTCRHKRYQTTCRPEAGQLLANWPTHPCAFVSRRGLVARNAGTSFLHSSLCLAWLARRARVRTGIDVGRRRLAKPFPGTGRLWRTQHAWALQDAPRRDNQGRQSDVVQQMKRCN